MLDGDHITRLLDSGDQVSVQDKLEIGQLIAAYAMCCDYGLIDHLVALFTADAVWDGREFRFPRCEGHDDIRSHFAKVCTPGMRQVHSMHEPLIRRGDDPQSARGLVYFSAMQGDGESVFAGPHAHGVYEDTYTRQDGTWLLQRRILHLVLVRK